MNREKYSDPTAEQAIANVMREDKRSVATGRNSRLTRRTWRGRWSGLLN